MQGARSKLRMKQIGSFYLYPRGIYTNAGSLHTACGLPQLRIESVPKFLFNHSKHKIFRYSTSLHTGVVYRRIYLCFVESEVLIS